MNRARNNAPSKCFAGLSAALAVASASAGVVLDAPGHAAPEGAAVRASGGEPGAAWHLVDWRGRAVEGAAGAFDGRGETELPPLPAGYYRMVEDATRVLPPALRATPLPEGGAASGGEGGLPCAAEKAPSGRGLPPKAGGGERATLATLAVVGASCRNPPCGVAGFSVAADCGIGELWREFDCPWNGGDAARTVADLAALAGLSAVRERLPRWQAMQPSPDAPPDSPRHRAIAALFRERGIGVSEIFLGAPKWASPLRSLPGDLAALCRGARDLAAAFGDEAEDWEFWNEPDIHFCLDPAWDFAAAQKAAYLGFKAAHPDRPVLSAGLCQPPDGPYLATLLENGLADAFDVFNYHTYRAPENTPAFFAAMRAALEKAGAGGKPIWITESGTNFEGPATNATRRAGIFAHSPEQELVVAEFAPKATIALAMEGVERSYFFLLGAYSERGGAKDWGLLRRDGTVKPAYAALATLAHEVGGTTLLGALDTPPGLRAYLFEHPDGGQTVAFWSESPVDTLPSGNAVVEPEPDFAREWRLEGVAAKDAEGAEILATKNAESFAAEAGLRLVDLCGREMPAPGVTAEGGLLLVATRFPAYLCGLRGLSPARRPAGAGELGAEHRAVRAVAPVVFRIDLAPGDFDISNRKTLAIAKGDAPRVEVQVWNLSETAVTGTVAASGAVLEGLPEEPVEIGPMACARFACMLRPEKAGARVSGTASPVSTLRLGGVFGGCEASPLAMPVLFEKIFLASCVAKPVDWRDPEKWRRNDSGASYSVRWDEEEQALRFDVAWDDPSVGRWFYPELPVPPGFLRGAVRAAFEVKTAQDKVENDFAECCLMLVRGEKGGSPGDWLPYSPPTGAWERHYVELSGSGDLSDVDTIRLGANPAGMRLTFWIRNLSILKPAR